jgi:long-subunit fatty acid transport protein
LLLLVSLAFGGGIVTNTNQSAEFTRTLNRNASTELDAVYFNPAGLSGIGPGLHLYLSNQTVSQGREITSDYVNLNSEMFEGSTFAAVFPNVYLAYQTNKLTFSAGFMPIGGGGSALFEDGLPSFEAPVSYLKTALAQLGVMNYRLDVDFEGSSIYFGGQGNVTFKVNDMISVAAGARFITASNTYVGHLKDIEVETAAGWSAPGDVARGAAAQATGGAASATSAAAGLQPFIDGGAGALTFDQLIAMSQVDQATVSTIAAGCAALGIPFDQSTSTPAGTQLAFQTAAATLTGTAAYLSATGAALDVQTADIEVDAAQTGTAFAPILGLNINLMDKLNIGVRYEMAAALELTNDTEVDGSGLFPDGAKTQADMPAMLAVGIGYKLMPALRIEADYSLYFNEDVDWDGREAFVENGTEIGFAADFALSDALLLSAGYLISSGGAMESYQTDLSNSLNSSTLGAGARFALNPTTMVSVGFSNTFYEEASRDGIDYQSDPASPAIISNETYMKSAVVFAFGIQKSF